MGLPEGVKSLDEFVAFVENLGRVRLNVVFYLV